MLSAFKAYLSSFRFLKKHGLTWFLWFPLIITLLVFFGGFTLTAWATEIFSSLLNDLLKDASWLPEWAGFINGVVYWVLWIILRILLYFVFAFIGGSIILLMMSPILTWLSERVGQELGDEIVDFSFAQFIRDLTRAAGLALTNGFYQLLLAILCVGIGFIPVIGLAAPFILFGVNAYFYGYNFVDYALERKQLSVRQSRLFVWKNKFSSLSLGAPFALWNLIPFIGPMTSGFIAVFATVVGTIEVERITKKLQHEG